MYLKKLISSTLILSLFSSNTCLLSKASIEIPDRYETLEGDYVAINNSIEDHLEEIEIIGNTVQNEDNLSDIQSVGDLYVNNKGEPILDKYGQEQYKIDIISSNRYPIRKKEWSEFLNKELIYSNRYSSEAFNTVGYTKSGDCVQVYLKIRKLSNPSNFVNPIAVTSLDSGGYNHTLISNSEWINLPVGECIERTFIREITPSTGRSFVSLFVGQTGENTNPDSNTGIFVIEDVRLDIVPDLNISLQENKTTILLPCKLMKIGDVADKLYWDKEKGKYIVYKRVVYDNFKKGVIENQGWANQINSINFHYRISDFYGNWGVVRAYCNNLKSGTAKEHYSKDTYGFITDTGGIVIKLPKNELSSLDIDGCTQWLKDKNSYLYYVNNNAEIIETNIASKLEIQTYTNRTYIYSETANGLNPTLKVVVDRIEEVSQEAVQNALTNTTSNNISLARMFVNMLPESLYKDQLQAKLNEIFSEDIVLDKLTATANLDVYIQSENILMMSLNTNTVTFEDYSGVEELEIQDAINISINSSLPYQLNAYIVGDIFNKEKDKILDLDVLNIRDSSETTYQKFDSVNNKLVLLDNISKGNDISHNIDLKLSGDKAHDADVYKTTIKFEAEQK